MFKRFILVILVTGWISCSFGQEILSGLQVNEAVEQAAANYSEAKKKCNCENDQTEAQELPFYDDFSVSDIYPDENKWENSQSVFVNQDFPAFPPNLKAATFDAIDSRGRVYSTAAWIPFEADVMTSVPVRTDSVFSPVIKSLGPDDDIYMSFFYHPQAPRGEPRKWQ